MDDEIAGVGGIEGKTKVSSGRRQSYVMKDLSEHSMSCETTFIYYSP